MSMHPDDITAAERLDVDLRTPLTPEMAEQDGAAIRNLLAIICTSRLFGDDSLSPAQIGQLRAAAELVGIDPIEVVPPFERQYYPHTFEARPDPAGAGRCVWCGYPAGSAAQHPATVTT